jgi:hypothetical protein
MDDAASGLVYHLMPDTRSRDAVGEDRFATVVVKLPQLLSFGPFLNPLVLLFIEIAMTSNLSRNS